ncbi:hypothetical protein GCM10027162_75890 [Streptomyces incanus]
MRIQEKVMVSAPPTLTLGSHPVRHYGPEAGNGAPFIPVLADPRRRHRFDCGRSCVAHDSSFSAHPSIHPRHGRRPGWSGAETGAQARPGAGPRAGSGASRLEPVEKVVTQWDSGFS